ncbi:MAG: N-acetylneuraminate synthase [Bacteroides sp.]|nr:N-acetylneuraminate synthase [Bacteroides sp.]
MKKTIIIAEAGVNHNGDYERAVEMVRAARRAGADYVKFQTAVPELVIAASAPQAEYQKENTGVVESQLDMCRRIHLPLSDYARLKEVCAEEGIGFMSTPFDLVSVDCLAALGQDWMKIPSGEITNLPYLRRVARAGIPVILSTGMSTMEEIRRAIGILTGEDPLATAPGEKNPSFLRKENLIVLHCNTQYPTPFQDVNLKAMLRIGEELGVRIGYSDHTLGIEIPIAAVALGAEVIEKHFTLDRSLPGPDHVASLEPEELAAMVRAIRNVEVALGNGCKEVSDSERPNIAIARKSIVAARDIAEGELFTEDNLAVKRPGGGISPMDWDNLIGRPAPRAYRYDELL